MDMRGTLNQMEMEEQEFLEKLEKGQEDFYKIQELNEYYTKRDSGKNR